jgi:hypothetical protein
MVDASIKGRFSEGIAEFVAVPRDTGTCEATFYKGAQTLTLRVTIGAP